MEVKDRIASWLEDLKRNSKPVEVVSFYQELPVKVKTELVDFDENFVQWKSELKLVFAVADSGKLYINFYDPFYKESRILGADITYYGNSFIETTFPKPVSEPKFKREVLRVSTSQEKPVNLFLLREGEKIPLTVRDLSEEGIGVLAPKGFFKLREPVKAELLLLGSSFLVEGKVVSHEPFGDKEKFGIKLRVKEKERRLLRKYVMERQREILNKIREIVG
ncbi:PilZ domain-containing protein [Thermovibrio sp.]